jgi:hypothetical protein
MPDIHSTPNDMRSSLVVVLPRDGVHHYRSCCLTGPRIQLLVRLIPPLRILDCVGHRACDMTPPKGQHPIDTTRFLIIHTLHALHTERNTKHDPALTAVPLFSQFMASTRRYREPYPIPTRSEPGNPHPHHSQSNLKRASSSQTQSSD